ncbi:hypothetical protein AHMF7605_11780 [Adhaeribacter arboris]|uniref:Uncharacterized protein n=1 Tax=Adhaeribacter arboris TaxID=2072846 RepID=A0A2T2YF58_9BACT|nr:hypothetical protein [Adhaeribacter arboris]PSR54151.1 hypothetical protein AHMF7605_11780 [Adhaeribacter arboris]
MADAVNVSGGEGLFFEAGINLDKYAEDLKKMVDGAEDMGDTVTGEFGKVIKQIQANEKALEGVADAYRNIGKNTTGAFSGVNQEVQAAIRAFEDLNAQIQRVNLDKVQLGADYQAKTISAQAYREELTRLNALEADLSAALAREAQALQQNEAVQKAATQAMQERREKIEALNAAYDKLSATDKVLPEIGGKMKEDIDGAVNELARLHQGLLSLQNFPQIELNTRLATTNVNQLTTDINELKQAAGSMPVFTLGDLEKEKQKFRELEAALEKLSDTDMAAGKGDQLLADMDRVEEKIIAINKALTTTPSLNLGNLPEAQARLESLRLSYSQLTDAQKDTPHAFVLTKQIEEAKKVVDELIVQTGKIGDNINTTGISKVKNDYRELLQIQRELGTVENSKIKIETDFKEGAIDANAYASALAKLEDEENALVTALVKTSTELRNNNEFQKAGKELIEEQTKSLIKLKAVYQNLPQSAKLDPEVGGSFQKDIAEIEQSITRVKAILEGTSTIDGFNKSEQGGQQFRKSIQQLEIEWQSYDAIVKKATDPATIKKYVGEMSRVTKEMQAIKNVGKDGFDAMGRPMKEQMGYLQKLEKLAQLYRKAIAEATNPELITKYNRKLQDTEGIIERTKNKGKAGFDEFGNAIDKNISGLSRFKSVLGNVAGALGLVGLIDSAVQLSRELFDVAVKASGIDRAFAKIGDASYLQKLREETKGFISDFDLERLTVKANNLKIPLKDMGTYLLFASERAKETGESVDKLTNDIVEGLGKESLRIIDNLGISQKTVREEMKKGGTMAEAVGRIMRREMGEAGVEVDTLADKTNRMSVTWDNAKKSVSGFFTRLFNPQGANDQVIGALTKRAMDQIGNIEKQSADQRNKTIEDQKKKVAELSKAYQEAKTSITINDGGRSERMAKQAGEELVAARNVLDALKKQNLEAEKKQRIAAGNLSIAEAEERLAISQQSLQDTNDPTERKRFQKQVDEYTAQLEVLRRSGNAEFGKLLSDVETNYQKLLDLAANKQDLDALKNGLEARINSLAPGDKKIGELRKKLVAVEKLIEQYDPDKKKKGSGTTNDYLKRYEDMMQKLDNLKNKYATKNMTPEDGEVQNIRNEFKNLATDIAQFNRDPKNKIKIKTEGLEELRDQVISDLRYRQDTEKLKIETERQKQIFVDYEEFKTQTTKTEADKRYQSDLNGLANYGEYLQNEIAKIDTTSNDADVQDRYKALKEQAKEYYNSQKELRKQDFIAAYQETISYAQKVQAINEQYAKKAQAIRDNSPGQNVDNQIAQLNKNKQAAIDATKDEYFQRTALYKKLNQDIIRYTDQQAKAQINAIKTALKANEDIAPELRKELEETLGKLEFRVKVGVDKSYKKELQEQKRLIEETLKTQKLSTAEYAKQTENLARVNDQLANIQAENFAKIGDYTGKIAGNLKEAGDLISKFDQKAGKAINTVADLAASAAQIFQGASTGDPFAIISGGIGLMTTFTEMMDKSAERQAAYQERQEKSLKRAKDAIAEMNRLLENGARQIEKALGVEKIAAYRRQLSLIQSDMLATIDKINGVELFINAERGIVKYQAALKKLNDTIGGDQGRPDRGTNSGRDINGNPVTVNPGVEQLESQLKTIDEVIAANRAAIEDLYTQMSSGRLKGNVEELRELLGNYEDLQDQLDQYRAKVQETVTGTTFSAIVDSLADGFKNGLRSAADFAQSFEEMMKTAIIQSLKMQALEAPLKAFYDQLALDSESGGSLDEGEIEKLREMYQSIITNAGKQFDELQKIAGLDFSKATGSDDANTLKGAIRRELTEETGQLLASQWGAQRIIQLEQLEVLKDVRALVAILAGNPDLPQSDGTGLIPSEVQGKSGDFYEWSKGLVAGLGDKLDLTTLNFETVKGNQILETLASKFSDGFTFDAAKVTEALANNTQVTQPTNAVFSQMDEKLGQIAEYTRISSEATKVLPLAVEYLKSMDGKMKAGTGITEQDQLRSNGYTGRPGRG